MILGIAALVVVIAGSVMAPEVFAKPNKGGGGGGGGGGGDFVIEAIHYIGMWGNTGSFEATGAIRDSGWADFPSLRALELTGDDGKIYIDLQEDGTFSVVGGTRKYRRLSASGTYTEEWISYGGDPPQWPEPPPDGVLAKGTYLLEGSTGG